MSYILSTSSTADMPIEFFQDRDIHYVPFTYIIDEKEFKDDLGQTTSYDEFFDRIDKGAMPTTSQVNVGTYVEYFSEFLSKGLDVVHLELSSGISSSAQSMMIAKETLKEKFPEREIYFHDSLAASGGLGFLVDMVADRRDSGMSAKDLSDWIEANKMKVQHWFFVSDLNHLKRGGRVSAASAAVGGLLGICPLLHVDENGKLITKAKVRGKKKVITEIVERMKTYALDRTNYSGKVLIGHSASHGDAMAVKELIEKEFPYVSDIKINSIGNVIGAHTGPGAVALFFYGDPRDI